MGRELLCVEKFVGTPGEYLLYDVLIEGNALEGIWDEYAEDYEMALELLHHSLGRLMEYWQPPAPALPPLLNSETSSPQT